MNPAGPNHKAVWPAPRINPPLYFGGAVAAMLVLHVLAPILRLIDWPWRWLGLVPIAAALMQTAWAGGLFRRRQTTVRPGSAPRHLVTSGPYRYSRNPMYLSLAGLLIGWAWLLGTLSPWLVIPLFIVLMSRNVIPWEERVLGELFGQDYDAYRQHVRRWI